MWDDGMMGSDMGQYNPGGVIALSFSFLSLAGFL